jgi:hypothetical protein
MITFIVAFLMAASAVLPADSSGRKLTIAFHFPSERTNYESAAKAAADPSKQFFTAGEPISFSVYLHALSVEDRMQFEALVIDDWRYDTPNYFADHRCPNVVLHVERLENGNWETVGFRVSSQGGGSDLKKAEVDVDLSVGGDDKKRQLETLRILELATREHTSDSDAKKQLRAMEEIFAPNKAGRYRISATYTGLFKKSGRLLLTTGPIEVVVKDAKPNTLSKSGNHVGALPAPDAAQLKIIRKLVVELKTLLPETLLSLKAGTAHDEIANTELGIQQIYNSGATQKLFVVLEIPTVQIETMARDNDSFIQRIKSGALKGNSPIGEQEYLMLQGFAAQLQCHGSFAARPQLTVCLSNGATITISAMADMSRNEFDKFVDALPIRTIDQVIAGNSLKDKSSNTLHR